MSRILSHAFAQRLAGAEHRGVSCIVRCILRRMRGRALVPLALRKLSRRPARESPASLAQRLVRVPGLIVSRAAARGLATEHDEVEQRVRAEAIGAVHRHAGRLADGHQTRHDRVRIAVLQLHHFAVIVRGDAAHVVVDRRQHRNRLPGDVDAGEDPRSSRRCRAAFRGCPSDRDAQVQVDVVVVAAHAAAFADLDRHRAADAHDEAARDVHDERAPRESRGDARLNERGHLIPGDGADETADADHDVADHPRDSTKILRRARAAELPVHSEERVGALPDVITDVRCVARASACAAIHSIGDVQS